MKYALHALLLVVAFSLVGCSTSRIVLLDADKKSSAIIVKTDQGELILDEPNTYTEISATKAKPSKPEHIDPQVMEEEYGALIASTPKPPINFLLYFEAGTTILTTQSRQLFPKIIAAIKERIPCDVNIIGHSDRTGSKEYNVRLSLQRAHFVDSWLSEQEIDISNIIVESYGEEAPLVPTADNIPEPKNRRVEIFIR